VQQRIVARGEVVDCGPRGPDVRRRERRGAGAGRGRGPVDGRVQPRHRRERRGEHDEEHREKPERPARVEAAQVERAVAREPAGEEPGDEEPGQHEEDVDAHEAAGQSGHAGVEQHHEQDRRPAHPLDVRPEAGARVWRGRGHGRAYGRV
jgi:hypothetical protein